MSELENEGHDSHQRGQKLSLHHELIYTINGSWVGWSYYRDIGKLLSDCEVNNK